MLRLGVDVGGTFTDHILFEEESGELFAFKTPSTPDDPSPVWSQQVKLADDRPNIHKLLLPSRIVSQKDSGKAVW